jgi:uncharacterized membrane protein
MDKFLRTVIWPILLLPAVYLAIVWNKLPKTIAIHFDFKGNADKYGNKNELLLAAVVMIGMSAIVYLLLSNIYRIDPKKYAAENKARLQRMGFAVGVFISTVLCLIIYSGVTGEMRFNTRFIFSGVGLLFALIGNYMHTIKPNYFAGFRLPWTLENEDNWKKTHLLAGKLWFIGGLLIAVVSLLVPANIAIIVFYAIMLPLVIIPCVYSYRLFQKEKKVNSIN